VFSITEDLSRVPQEFEKKERARRALEAKRVLALVHDGNGNANNEEEDNGEEDWEDLEVSEDCCDNCGGICPAAPSDQGVHQQQFLMEDEDELYAPHQRRCQHLPGCYKFEPFNSSSGKMAANGKMPQCAGCHQVSVYLKRGAVSIQVLKGAVS
jgi:hypothetical protein